MRSLLAPVHWLVWKDARRRARNLLRFAAVEADGGRDLVRAAELTGDPTLRRLFLHHAADERRHADLFRTRGLALLRAHPARDGAGETPTWLAPGERGLDDVRVEQESAGALLAFLHLSERRAARDFANYLDVLGADPSTRKVFQEILHDETFHMTYTRAQLVRVAPQAHRSLIWKARLHRFWKGYLRLAGALAGLLGGVILTLQYFILLPPFALLVQRAARRQPRGWQPTEAGRGASPTRQY